MINLIMKKFDHEYIFDIKNYSADLRFQILIFNYYTSVEVLFIFMINVLHVPTFCKVIIIMFTQINLHVH